MGKAQKGKGFQREGTGTHFSSLPNFPPFFPFPLPPSPSPNPPPPTRPSLSTFTREAK